MLVEVISHLKDILFPIYCLSCNQEGEWLCPKCLNEIKFNHQTDRAVEFLDGLTAFFNYDEKQIVGQMIKLLKYNYIRELDNYIQKILTKSDIILDEELIGATIIPVPLHSRRLRERGFNQAEIIAKIFQTQFLLGNIDNSILQRKKYTSQQAKLKREDRLRNLKNAFVFSHASSIPKSVILVDDIYTTGVTMKECASVLRQAGVKKVWGIVLARGKI